jgi:hypothetical protein
VARLVEELAADIFMGRFSPKFLRAAQLAGQMLGGSLYERYYGIDYAEVLAIDDVARGRRHAAPTSAAFDALCRRRAGDPTGRWNVAANGMIIEQAQILTTHNLATLTGPFGVGDALRVDWPRVARTSFERGLALAGRLRNNPRPLRMVKDLAYAWRQTIFFLTRMTADEVARFLAWAEEKAVDQPAHVAAVMGPVVGGLRDVADGTPFDRDGTTEHGRRLLGWTVGRHWVLEATGAGRRAA